MSIRTIFLLVGLLFVLQACAIEDVEPLAPVPGPDESFFEPRPETVILDEDTNTDALTFDGESGRTTYRLGSPQLDSIRIGSVIASGPNPAAPAGFLRRVTGRRQSGGQLVLDTEPANLPDAFSSYRWRLGATPGLRPRSEGEPGIFSLSDAVDTTFVFPVPGESYSFELEFQFIYTLDFRSEFDFNLSGGGSGIEYMNVGVDRFSMDSLVLDMGFRINGERNTDLNFSDDEVQQFLLKVFEISLSPIPVGPGASPVYITPSIAIDLSNALAYDAKIGQRFTFYTTKDFQGLLQVNGPGLGPTLDLDFPEFNMNADFYFEGEFSYSTGLSIALGISPYSRSLFTLGSRLTVGPRLNVAGTASAGLRAGVPTGEFSAQLDINLDGSAGVFIDADFFGWAPDSWDQDTTLWEGTDTIYSLQLDNSCGFYFSSLLAEVECVNDTARLYYTVRTAGGNQSNFDLDGTYDVYFDGLLVETDADPIQTNIFTLPADVSPGIHRVRFIRQGGQSIFLCEKDVMVTVPDCATLPCTGDFRVQDDNLDDQAYCAQVFRNDRWLTSNLFTPLSDGSLPDCLDNEAALCRAYGGYYTFNEVLDVAAEESPTDAEGLCPDGYHVPSVEEWLALFGLSGSTQPNSDGEYFIPDVVGPYKDPFSWTSGSTADNLLNGFRAQAAGVYTKSSNPVFTDVGDAAYFWTSTVTPDDPDGAFAVEFNGLSNDVLIRPTVRQEAMGCRCIQD